MKELQRIIYNSNFSRKTIHQSVGKSSYIYLQLMKYFLKLFYLMFLMSVHKQNWTLCDLKKQK